MRFSVIIPCYNSSATIIQSMDSVVQQSFNDWEMIVVDDCSTDETVTKVQQYINEHPEFRIRLYCKEKNSGPGNSRNIAMKMAIGDYFIFLDSDDFYTKEAFAIINECIEKTNADVVGYGNTLEIGNNIRKCVPDEFSNAKAYVALRGGSLCTFTASKKVWNNMELPNIKNAEDIAIVPVLFMRAKKIQTIKQCLYRYIYNKGSLSSKKNKGIYKSFYESFEVTKSFDECRNFPEEIEFHGIKTILYGAVLNAIQAGVSITEAKRVIASFEEEYPHWYKNKYILYYPQRKRLFLKLVRKHHFFMLRMYVLTQNLYLKIFS